MQVQVRVRAREAARATGEGAATAATTILQPYNPPERPVCAVPRCRRERQGSQGTQRWPRQCELRLHGPTTPRPQPPCPHPHPHPRGPPWPPVETRCRVGTPVPLRHLRHLPQRPCRQWRVPGKEVDCLRGIWWPVTRRPSGRDKQTQCVRHIHVREDDKVRVSWWWWRWWAGGKGLVRQK